MTLTDEHAAELLQRRSLRDEVFEVLHKRIIAGAVPPGGWLRQEEIASQLNVSQTPVREALDLLVSAGLAERVPYRGVRVVELTAEEIVDAYGLRLLLEPAAARLAAERADPAQVESLKRLHERMRGLVTLNDMSALRQLSREFHERIVRAAGSPLLARLYQMVANNFPDWMLYEAMFHHPEVLDASLTGDQDEHLRLIEAIAARDPEAAAVAAQTHILELGKDLQAFLNIPASLLKEKERQFAPFLFS
ncbi:MAG: GntR family transcriptional regulator [Chloroflexota bacterium]